MTDKNKVLNIRREKNQAKKNHGISNSLWKIGISEALPKEKDL